MFFVSVIYHYLQYLAVSVVGSLSHLDVVPGLLDILDVPALTVIRTVLVHENSAGP